MSRFKNHRDKDYDKWLAAVDVLKGLDADGAHRAWAEASFASSMEDWAKSRGLKLAGGHPCIQRLLGKRCRYNCCIGRGCFPPMHDHCSLWLKGGKPYVFVSQPYPGSTSDIEKCIGFAKENGLTLRIGTWPAWHYPGAVLMMEYFRNGDGSNIAVGP